MLHRDQRSSSFTGESRAGGAGKTGFEPATSGVTDQHSNQLSYFPLPLQSHQPFPFGNIQKGSTTVETRGSARSGAGLRALSALCWRYATEVDKKKRTTEQGAGSPLEKPTDLPQPVKKEDGPYFYKAGRATTEGFPVPRNRHR
jgi:hypothetical protein